MIYMIRRIVVLPMNNMALVSTPIYQAIAYMTVLYFLMLYLRKVLIQELMKLQFHMQ